MNNRELLNQLIEVCEIVRPAPPVSEPASEVVSDSTPAPAPEPVSLPEDPVQEVDYKARGYDLSVTVRPEKIVSAVEVLDRAGFAIDTITGVDWIAAGQMEVVYDFFRTDGPLRIVLRSRLPRANPEIPTISTVFPGANWHERETHDFFGIRFSGHPNLTPFLLEEDATYHPLLKDFSV
jgi:NADH-quinone oxidoreductase subunit C